MKQNNLIEKRNHGTPDFPFHIYSHRDINGNYYVSHHWHNEIEIIYFEHGEMELYTNQNNMTFFDDDIYILNSKQIHSLSGKTKSIHHAIVFNIEMLGFSLYDKCQIDILQPFIEGKFIISNDYSKKQKEDIKYILSEIIDINRKNPNDLLLLKIKLLYLIHYIYKEKLFKHNNNSDLVSQEKIKYVISYIHKNYQNNITLNEISNVIYMSPNYFCSFFKKYTGLSFKEYLNNYRCEKAEKLILNTDLKILDIALLCGFDNISYFIRKFKNIYGYTPQIYRKK